MDFLRDQEIVEVLDSRGRPADPPRPPPGGGPLAPGRTPRGHAGAPCEAPGRTSACSAKRLIHPSDSSLATAFTVSGQVSQQSVGKGLPWGSMGRFLITRGCPGPHQATTSKGMSGSRPSWAATVRRSEVPAMSARSPRVGSWPADSPSFPPMGRISRSPAAAIKHREEPG